MKCGPAARQRRHHVSVQAHVRKAYVKQQEAVCRNQNRMRAQKALMQYLLLGKLA